jgi:hypothetical protein
MQPRLQATGGKGEGEDQSVLPCLSFLASVRLRLHRVAGISRGLQAEASPG